MSAGAIQLAAIGQQDAYLTGSPSVTYFSGVYSRHTPFVLEAYDIPFLGNQLLFGTQQTCKIPFKGDIIRGLTLKAQMPFLNNPGNAWAYPTVASSTFFPHLIHWEGSLTAPTKTYHKSDYFGISYYSTVSASTSVWLTAGQYYNSSSNQLASIVINPSYNFQFSNCVAIEVDPTIGIFWGLDPKNFSTVTASGNLVYYVNGTRTSDFSLEQAGWGRGTGVPTVNNRGGFFSNVTTAINLSGAVAYPAGSSTYFMNVSSQNFTNYGISQYAQNTGTGCMKITQAGLYSIRGSMISDGSIYSAGIGFNTVDGHPAVANYLAKQIYTTSPNPTTPFILPINISTVPAYLYTDVSFGTTATQVSKGAYVSVGPLNSAFMLGTTTALTSNIVQIPLSKFTLINSDIIPLINLYSAKDSFSMSQAGVYSISCSFTALNNYVMGFAIGVANSDGSRPSTNSNGYIYSYNTIQGRNPTFDYVLPLVVNATDVLSPPTWYYMDVFLSNVAGDSLLGSNACHISFMQNASVTSPNLSSQFPQNGMLLTPQAGASIKPGGTFNFAGEFNQNGTISNYVAPDATGLEFSNTVMYVITAVVCTDQPISSISFGDYIHSIELGLLPPYTFSLPYIVTQRNTTIPVKVVAPSGTTLYSNTYFSVFPYASNVSDVYNYVDSVGTYMIDTAELRIGGQLVQSISGEGIEIYNDLYVTYENQPGLKLLTGKLDTSNVYDPGRTYYINLPFYFYGHSELSIPLCALDRQDVEVAINFRPFKQLTNVSNLNAVSQILNATIIVEYGYLSDTEVSWMKRNRLDYLIIQNQVQNYTLPAGFSTGIFDLPFLNPVRELFFVIQLDGSGVYDFTRNGLQSMALTFNGQEFFGRQESDALYLGTIQPYNHYTHFPDRIFYMYSFANNPSDPRPTGQINFSRIKQKLLEVNVTPDFVKAKQLRVYALSYNVLRIENGLAGLLFNFF
jgi:hypothetical protein